MTISDLHGRSCWKNFGDINNLLSNTNSTPEFDKYIFIGDYVDSFDVSNEIIKENLLEIISFKKMYPDNVILLWGNHDVEYFINKPWLPVPKGIVTGFRVEMHYDLYDIFTENKELFQLSYQIKNYIWTHAGIHEGYYKFVFSKAIKNMYMNDLSISEQLNESFKYQLKCLFDCDWYRGGRQRVGGPLWCSKNLVEKKPLKNYKQIVGHSWVKTIYTKKYDNLTDITFCDILDNKEMFLTTILN